MNILTVSHLFTFVHEGTMHAEFNSVILFTVLYLRFQHCAQDLPKVTAQHNILEFDLYNVLKAMLNPKQSKKLLPRQQ